MRVEWNFCSPLKSGFLLLVLILCFFVGQLAFPLEALKALNAQENGDVLLKDAISGKTESYLPVNLLMGTKDLIADVPAILFRVDNKDRTLVPIRVITENLGAKVGWNPDSREVTIDYLEKRICLTIDSSKATVNGNAVDLPNGVPAKLMTFEGVNRTLVPVRFISEQFGLKVGWDADTRTVTMNKNHLELTNIAYGTFQGHQRIRLETSGGIEATSFVIHGVEGKSPNQIVVDLPNTSLNVAKALERLQIDQDGLVMAELSEFQVIDHPLVRLVISTRENRGYELISDASGVSIVFGNVIEAIRSDQFQKDLPFGLSVQAVEPLAALLTTEGKAVHIDFEGARLGIEGGSTGTRAVEGGDVTSYQYSQLPPTGSGKVTTRVTINTTSETFAKRAHLYQNGTETLVRFTQLNYEKISPDKSQLKFPGQGQFEVVHQEKERLVHLFAKNGQSFSSSFKEMPKDGLLESYGGGAKQGLYSVEILLAEGVTFTLKEVPDANQGTTTMILFEKAPTSSGSGGGTSGGGTSDGNGSGGSAGSGNTGSGNTGSGNTGSGNTGEVPTLPLGPKRIVLDAGHGGMDPGATSTITKVKEKDIVFSIALRLKALLEARGFVVIMTRDSDNYIGLKDRVAIANAVGADAFLSIHANTATVPTATGVEMLYVSDSRDSKRLGDALQAATVELTQARSRGVLERPNLVVIRETMMPAILAEVGFLSHAQEALLLQDLNYQNKIAEGLAEGLYKYFISQ